MGDVNDLTGKVGLDTTDFKTAIAGMNRDIRVIESGFRATAAGLGDWASSASGVEARIKALNSEIETQTRKVAAVRGEYERVAAAKGADSKAAQDLQIRLNKENETLGKMQSELGTSKTKLDELGKSSTGIGGKLDTLKSKLGGVVSGLGKLASEAGKAAAKLAAGLLAGAAGAAVGLGALVVKTAATADDLVELSDKTGLSTTKLQELAYIGEQTGTDLDTVTGSLAKLIRNMASAAGGTGPAAKAFQELGVNVTDANGNLRDSQDVFNDAIAALGKIPNETERDALAMQLFGKSAQELNPLINAGADGLAQMADDAHKVGAVMSEENVKAAADLNDKLASLKMGIQGTAMTLVGALVPGLTGAADMAGDFVKRFVEAISKFDEAPDAATQMITSLINDIVTQIPKFLQSGLKIITTLLQGLIKALPQILPVVIQVINTLVQFLVQNLPLIIDAGIQIILALINGIVPMLPSLVEAAIQMIVTLANGIAAAIPQLIPVIADIIPRIILILIQNLPLLINAALQIIIALVNGLVAALPTLITYIPQIIQAIVDALIAALPMIGEAAVQIIVALVNGLISALPQIITAAGQIITTLVQGVKDLYITINEVGISIVEGIWAGIKAKAEWFTKMVQDFFKGIVDGVKNALHIKSPSVVFAEIGENMALGLGVGFSGAFRDIERNIRGAVAGLGTMSMPVSLAPATTAAPAVSQAAQRPQIVIYGGLALYGVQDAPSLIRELNKLTL